MKRLNPITTEYIRRISILILLALFAWMFFYSPSDIYEIQVMNYAATYQDKVTSGLLDPSKTSLDEYIVYKMKGPYPWSKRKQKIVEVKGKSGEFLNHIVNVNRGDSSDDIISEHRSPDTFWSGNSYFFRSSELPENFLSQTFLKHPNYLMIKDEDGNILIYIYLPRPNIPNGAAYYTRFNAVYLADILGVFLWTGAWMFFFLPDDSAPMVVRYIFLLFFAVFALAIVLPTVKYASNWYLFTEDSFQWSDTDGIGKVSLKDIVSIKPYKKQLPKWVAPLIILFGRGQPVATGAGMISMSSSPEIGMEITTRSGKKIKVMANYLEADKVFTERFQELEKKIKREDKKKEDI